MQLIHHTTTNAPQQQDPTLTVYQKIGDPMAAIEKLGEIIAYSGLFGCTKKEQGQVLAMQCLVEGKPPLELAKTYHMIDGKLSMKADVMLARYLLSGGSVKWLERSNDRVKAEWTHRGNTVVIEHTFEEHKASGNALGKDGKLKDNWRKTPRQMLTARVISEGVRLLAPEINFGIYTPEEVADFNNEAPAKPASKPAAPQQAEVVVESTMSKLEALLEPFEEQANAFLRSKKLISENQNFRDISNTLADKILGNPESFLKQIQ